MKRNQNNSKHKYQSYQYPKEDKEILDRMKHPDYEGFNMALPPNATLLDKTKYRICKQILSYEYDNKLTTEELAERINLGVSETKEILLCHIHKFTLDRLITYADRLFSSFEIGIIKAEPRENFKKVKIKPNL